MRGGGQISMSWLQALEIGDLAIGAAARQYAIPARAKRPIRIGLNIETGIEIGRAALPPKQGAKPAAIVEHQVNAARRGESGRAKLRNPDAFRTFMFFPFNDGRWRRLRTISGIPLVRRRHARAHHWHTDDDALLNGHLGELNGKRRPICDDSIRPAGAGHPLR